MMKVLEWPTLSLELDLFEMLCHNLKQALEVFHAGELSNVAELNNSAKKSVPKFPFCNVKESLPVITTA